MRYINKTEIALLYFQVLAESTGEPNKYDATLTKDREKARILFTHHYLNNSLNDKILKDAFAIYMKQARLELFSTDK